MGLLLALHVQQAVSVPQLGHALRTHGHLVVLAVLHQGVADADATPHATGDTGDTRLTGEAWRVEEVEGAIGGGGGEARVKLALELSQST